MDYVNRTIRSQQEAEGNFAYSTVVTNAVVESFAANTTFAGPVIVRPPAVVIDCVFEGPVLAEGATFTRCSFKASFFGPDATLESCTFSDEVAASLQPNTGGNIIPLGKINGSYWAVRNGRLTDRFGNEADPTDPLLASIVHAVLLYGRSVGHRAAEENA